MRTNPVNIRFSAEPTDMDVDAVFGMMRRSYWWSPRMRRDVFVDEAHRGRGVGRAMVERLASHPDVATVRRWCLATRDAQELHRTMDFVDVAPGHWMERRNPPGGWEE